MNISKKQFAIFYIEKDKGTLYRTGVKPIVIAFPQSIVTHLEIIDKSKFEQLITNVITLNELKPTNIFIVLSKEILFEKEIKDVPLSLQTIETEKFLDMVPFHHIVSKSYNFSNKTIIVAADKDFCVNILDVFKENLFPVIGVLPLSIIEEKFPLLKDTFIEKFDLQKIQNLKKYSLPLEIEQEEKMISNELPSFKNIRFVGLISLATFLLAVLGLQIYTQFLVPAAKPQSIKQVEVKQIVTVTPTPPIASPSAILYPTKKPLRK